MRRPARADRGATAIVLTLVVCFISIPLSALAVDIGQQRIVRSDMQSTADTVALDMARLLAGGTTPTDAAAQADFRASALGGTPKLKVYTGYIDPNATWISNQALGCSTSHYNAYFQDPSITGKPANAVLVAASGSTKFSLSAGSGGACRSSIGNAFLKACVTMDSYAAALNTGDSTVLGPLGKLLGTNINSTVLGSSGILTANLDVLSFLNVLKTNLNVGSLDQVLASQVTAAQVVQAEIDALNQQGGTASASATLLQQQVLANVGSLAPINVGQLVGVTQGDSSALAASINPLDLAAAAAQLANGSSAASLSVSSDNLTGLSASLTIGSKPTRVCLGQPKQTMGQTKLTATANLAASGTLTGTLLTGLNGLTSALNTLLGGVLGTLGSLLGSDTYDIPQITLGTVSANVALAQASGTVTALNCTGGQPTSISVLEESSLAPATVTVPIIISDTRHFGFLGSQHETKTSTLTLTISTQVSGSQSTTATLAVPGDYDKGKAGPSGDLSVQNLQVTTALTSEGTFSNGEPLVATLLGGVTKLVTSINTSLLSPLESTLVAPLLNTLTSTLKSAVGLTIAGSTYTPERTPSCNNPKLVG